MDISTLENCLILMGMSNQPILGSFLSGQGIDILGKQ